MRCGLEFERKGWSEGYVSIAGVDEVGVGSLFGPVVAAAVILDPARRIRGIRDSKQLEPREREILAAKIRSVAIAWAVGIVDAGEIDRINILQASRLAMKMAVEKLRCRPDLVLVDARQLDIGISQVAIVKGDARSDSVAAASIVAKVERDAMLDEWDRVYPGYGLGSHKGYPTPFHKRALREHGPTPLHRMSYAPIKETLQKGNTSEEEPPPRG